MKKEVKHNLYVIFFTLIFIILIYRFISPSFTGNIILENSYQKTFSDFTYDSGLIEVADDIKLKSQTLTSIYTEETRYSLPLIEAIKESGQNVTDKVNSLDDYITNVDKNNLFDIAFNETLTNSDLINLYLKGITDSQSTDIYLCPKSTSCNYPGFGSILYTGEITWLTINISNLSQPISEFNLDPPVKIKLDYINATKILITEHSETHITYPSHASLTTSDLEVPDLGSWDSLEVEQILNGQNLTYEYSLDSGLTWFDIPEDYNLSSVSTSTKKIRIKVNLFSNETSTPILKQFNLTYSTSKDIPTYYEINNTSEISTLENTPVTINSTELKTELTLSPLETLSNIEFTLSPVESNHNSTLTRVKELEISSPSLNNKLQNATLRVYYTDSDIVNLNEASLKIYYYNETSSEWQALPTLVNMEENYLEANLEHFSIYGIFGEPSSSSGSSSSPSSSGSSSSSNSGSSSGNSFSRGTKTPESPAPTETETPKETTEVPAETPETQTQQEVLPVQTEASLTGNFIKISKILVSGKLNKLLWLLFFILMIIYIFIRLIEKKILKIKRFKFLKKIKFG